MQELNAYGMTAVFDVAEARISPSTAAELFSEVLPGHEPKRSAKLRATSLEKRTRALVARSGTVVRYRDMPDWESPDSLDIGINWAHRDPNVQYESTDWLLVGYPLGDGQLLMEMSVRDPEVKLPPEVTQFLLERARAVADLLEPRWGAMDVTERFPYGTEQDPRQRLYWLNFFGPEHEEQARALADRLGVEVDERPWGGFGVQCWEDPFNPPEDVDSMSAEPLVGSVGDPKAGSDGFVTTGLLVAGLDVTQPLGENGATLVDRLAAPGASLADLADQFRAARQAGEPLSPGEIRLFPGARGRSAVLGLPVASVPVVGEHPFLEEVDVQAAEDALARARTALEKLEVTAEPGLHLVLADDAGAGGI